MLSGRGHPSRKLCFEILEKNKKNNESHCCQFMKRFLKDQRIPIEYVAKYREYGIRKFHDGCVLQLIYHCPWCGCELPDGLGDEWENRLKKDFGIDPYEDEDKIPKDFESDQWWKKREIKNKEKSKKNVDAKRDILHEVYNGIIGQTDATYQYYDVLGEDFKKGLLFPKAGIFGMSEAERKAFVMFSIPLAIVANWRYEGWPSECFLCYKNIDIEKNDWIAFKKVYIEGEPKCHVLSHSQCHLDKLDEDDKARVLEQHCCESMKHYLDEEKVSLNYHPMSRSYYIDHEHYSFAHILYYEYARQPIYYCPWCGKELPEALNDTFFDFLEKDGPYNLLDEENGKEPPKEFQSDQWWKKRKL